jgi:hypothetical protein
VSEEKKANEERELNGVQLHQIVVMKSSRISKFRKTPSMNSKNLEKVRTLLELKLEKDLSGLLKKKSDKPMKSR